MKHQALTFLFVTCMFSSLALSQSQTDAPLMPDDATTPVVQKANCDSKRGHTNKKVKSAGADSGNAKPAKTAGIVEQQTASIYASSQTSERKN
jgi:prophage tail gpP-like protein